MLNFEGEEETVTTWERKNSIAVRSFNNACAMMADSSHLQDDMKEKDEEKIQEFYISKSQITCVSNKFVKFTFG